MYELHDVVLPVSIVLAGVVVGLAVAWCQDLRAGGADTRWSHGSGLTVPVVVSVGGDRHRASGVVDGGRLRVVGPRTHLLLDGAAYLAAGQRQHPVDDETVDDATQDDATQRGFVDAGGTLHLVGAVAEWEAALQRALRGPSRPASRWRRLAAAVPRWAFAGLVASGLLLMTVQVVWAAGHDVQAQMVRVVSSYEWLTAMTGGLALVGAAVTTGVTAVRLHRPVVRLVARPAAALDLAPQGTVTVDPAAALLTRLGALAAAESWDDGVSDAPALPRYRPHLIALSSARWWPTPVLVGGGLLIVERPDVVRYGLLVAGGGAALWAVATARRTWFAVRPAYIAPVTSEWDYRLVRTPDNLWFALLLAGQQPHWIVPLWPGRHPSPVGRCGIRGDLRDGGAVQLRIGESFWMTDGPVERVSAELLRDIDEHLHDRLQEIGTSPAPPDRGTRPAPPDFGTRPAPPDFGTRPAPPDLRTSTRPPERSDFDG
ncbi:MAG: hypothetical protein ACRCYX_02155 [Dermatophilaceae bacterium]